MSKKWPYPNYIIIPAAGSLIGESEALRGMTAAQANELVDRIVKDHGARRTPNDY